MAEDVTYDIKATDKTAKGTLSAASRFDRLNKRIKAKADEWEKFGDNAGKKFAGKAISRLSKVADVGQQVGTKLVSGMSTAISVGGPIVSTALTAVAIAAAAAAAPALAAGISAGLVLGLGGGVLALGIKAAADSPQVQSAWKRFTDRSKKAFAGFGGPFIEPLTRALDTFGDGVDRVAPQVKALAEKFAPLIDKVAPALTKFVENAMPGLTSSLEKSIPLFNTIAEKLPAIGTAVGKFFDKINTPELKTFVDDLLTSIPGLIMMAAEALAWLSKMYVQGRGFYFDLVRVALNAFGQLIDGAVAAFGWIPKIGPKLEEAQKKFNGFKNNVNKTLNAIEDEEVKITIVQSVVYRNGAAAYPVDAKHIKMSGRSGAFAETARDSGTSRTGGPAQVALDSSVNVYLDGEPVRAMVQQEVRQAMSRATWRNAQVAR